MLAEEVDDWCINISHVLDVVAEVVTWVVFNVEFVRNYFPGDVCGKKEIGFLELEHGKLSVTKYAVRFVELAKFYSQSVSNSRMVYVRD